MLEYEHEPKRRCDNLFRKKPKEVLWGRGMYHGYVPEGRSPSLLVAMATRV
jgi:hypothetical protein